MRAISSPARIATRGRSIPPAGTTSPRVCTTDWMRRRGSPAARSPQARSGARSAHGGLPRPLAQLDLAHLAGRGLRQLAELDGTRSVEAGEVLAREGDELRLAQVGSRLQRDVGLRPLAPALVRHR